MGCGAAGEGGGEVRRGGVRRGMVKTRRRNVGVRMGEDELNEVSRTGVSVRQGDAV